MSTIGMFLQTGPTVEGRNLIMKNNGKSSEGTLSFPSLLKEGDILSGKAPVKGHPTSGELPSSILNLLEKMNISSSNLSAILSKGNEGIEDSRLLEQLISKGPGEDMTVSADSLLQSLNLLAELNVQSDPAELIALQQQLTEILSKIENLLSEVSNQQDSKKVAPKILELLQKWSELESKVAASGTTTNLLNTSKDAEVNSALKEILVAYQNRTKMTSKQQYNTDSQVTVKDVAKWIENALHNQQMADKASLVQNASPVQNASFNPNTVMPKLEQYVIYVNQNQTNQSVEQQVMDQFQQVMKSSKFLSMPNGLNQLSIALRPQNLGEMMVRLTQINGEMTVNIVVTTQAAKEMLESNINQLKHMFSPQQVVIERQDVAAGQAQSQAKQNDEQLFNEQNQSQSEQSNQQEGNRNEEDFEAHLNDLILNEKV
jgi:flagellar hook-length control protein FliK